MPKTQNGLPPLFLPADVAEAIGMSEWWVKEQARRGRIPFTKPGRSYRFTADQFAEIIQLYETRPAPPPENRLGAATTQARMSPRRAPEPASAPVRLRARVPRRSAVHQQANAA
ncbi:helix-turn-helix domain-containing protein [Kitasatospora sp. NPDC058115]|uniref:helix-turn-helix domain-containing protein n=1 Tax=Kitasatospora sp. NPDC058115 TaxID=3346347 RepID=UPI0036DACF07